MQMVKKQCAAVVALGLIVSQSSWAEVDSPQQTVVNESQSSLLFEAFDSSPSSDVRVLDESAMSETQGELWPWIIGVAALDVSLASFFWGEYVPIMAAASGSCVTCDIGSKSR